MRPASDAFLTTVRSSHTMAARARVCTTFQTGTNPTGTLIPILAGDVVQDCTADVRATLDLTTRGTWPTRQSHDLGPYGSEIFVERGVQLGGGVTVYVSLGYFQIQTTDQDTPPNGPLVLTGADRMKRIIDARLLAPVQFLPTDTRGTAVNALVLAVYPTATIEWDNAGARDTALGRTVSAEDDRYACLLDIVTSCGKIMYWDYRGVLVIKDLPSAVIPVWDVTAGQGGVLVKASRGLSREGVYNAVVASGEASDEVAPARGVAIDNAPDSPTYFYGTFGQVPRYYSSPLLLTDSAAGQAAATMLAKALGLPYAVNFTAVCNPALEPYDAVRVRYSNKSSTEVHVIETLTVPLLAADPMTATTREQSLTATGVIL